MALNDLRAEAFALIGANDAEAATELLFGTYERGVSQHRKAREAESASVGFKVAEKQTLELIDDSTVQSVDEAMSTIRSIVFDTVLADNDAAVLFYERLGDYASGDLKVYRDYVVNQTRNSMELPEDEDTGEAIELDYTVDELRELRAMAEAAWNFAGKPALVASEEDETVAQTKKLKDGGLKLAFSQLRGLDNSTPEKTDNSVSVSRLIYTVDGEELPAGTSLSVVGMWYLSSYDWTVSVSDIKEAVQQATGSEYKDLDAIENVEINGHVFSRRRDKVS